MRKRFLATLLALAMVLSVTPFALAEDGGEVSTPTASDNNIPEGMNFTSDSYTHNVTLPTGCNFTDSDTVYDGTTYYETLTAALNALHTNAKGSDHTLWCKPGADVGTMTHGHVCDNLTVYGNGGDLRNVL